jgi:hypothetical protein
VKKDIEALQLIESKATSFFTINKIKTEEATWNDTNVYKAVIK